MIEIPTDDIFDEERRQIQITREKLIAQAREFLYNNQECYVAQWLIQNPFANIADYRLKFVYNDTTKTGYSVEMEKIENVQ